MATMTMMKELLRTLLWMVLWGATPVKAAAVLTTLVSFAGTNGANPDAGVVQAADGMLYGTTTGGGVSNLGTIFRISPAGGTLVSLASFTHTNGAYPKAGLLQRTDADFPLYGTTSSGGVGNLGTVFQITTNGVLSVLASFRGTNGANPQSSLAAGGDGKFYGTTYYGGTNDWPNGYGVVFQVTTNGDLLALASFANTNGAEPYAPVQRMPDGNFYGTTQLGGAAGYGAVFKVSTAGVLTLLASFYGTNGAFPYGALVSGLDGHLYGTTLNGGASDLGTVFRVTTNGALTMLLSFSGTNGAQPFAGLTPGSDGEFYGTSAQGGASAFGTVFRISTNGILTTLINFSSTNGANPYSGVIQGGDGALYGTTGNGGDFGLGTVYRLSFPVGPILQSISQNGSGLALNWNASLGQSYEVQYKTNLSQADWNHWITIAATNATMSLTDSIGPESQRFYRVILLP